MRLQTKNQQCKVQGYERTLTLQVFPVTVPRGTFMYAKIQGRKGEELYKVFQKSPRFVLLAHIQSSAYNSHVSTFLFLYFSLWRRLCSLLNTYVPHIFLLK